MALTRTRAGQRDSGARLNGLSPSVNMRMHHSKPQWWKPSQDHHRRITGWKLWALVKVTKELVGTRGVRVMVGMATEFEQEQPTHRVI